ncbi:hypothetical protein Ancab_011750 [Ancistrocladus abbreviatus]
MESTNSQRGGGGGVSVSPSHTPRSTDKALRYLRSGDSNSSRLDRDKGVNVQVVVRCRPLNEDEQRVHTPVVITCNEIRREVSAAQFIANKQIDRTLYLIGSSVQHLSRKTCLIMLFLPLLMQFLRAIIAPFLPMVRQAQGKHTQWKEGQGKRTGNFQVMQGSSQEQFVKFLTH